MWRVDLLVLYTLRLLRLYRLYLHGCCGFLDDTSAGAGSPSQSNTRSVLFIWCGLPWESALLVINQVGNVDVTLSFTKKKIWKIYLYFDNFESNKERALPPPYLLVGVPVYGWCTPMDRSCLSDRIR